MTDQEITLEHLKILQEGLADWQRYKKKYDLETLKKDRDVQNMVLHAILVTIQSCIDIAHHLINHLNLSKPSSYRESFEILETYGYLNEEVSKELQDLAGFRNVLVHIYWHLDIERVFEILQSKDNIVQRFLAEIIELIS